MTFMKGLTLLGIRIAQLKRYADKKMDGDTNPRGAHLYVYFLRCCGELRPMTEDPIDGYWYSESCLQELKAERGE